MKNITAILAAAVFALGLQGAAEAGCCNKAKGKDKAAICDLKNGECPGYEKKTKAHGKEDKKETSAAKEQKKS